MIGIAGAGEIVTAAHLPTYARRGWPVRAIFDPDLGKAQRAAAQWGTHAAASLGEILGDPEVTIVDIAVPPEHQPAIVRAALSAGKHVLAQKPLAESLEEAADLVALAQSCDRLLAVNQQMRWSPVGKALEKAIRGGQVGAVQYVEFDLNLSLEGLDPDSWLAHEAHPVTLLNSIHFLDLSRHLLGEAVGVQAIMLKCDPRLPLTGEQGALMVLEMTRCPNVVIADRRNARGHHQSSFLMIGDAGAVRGELGLWTNYPDGVSDVIEYRASSSNSWVRQPVEGKWIPDAFAGPMGQLIDSIRDGSELTVSGADHLKTLMLVAAVWRSATGAKGTVDVVSGA